MLSALLTVLGLLIGSFVGVVAARGPARWGLVEGDSDESFVTGRSRCASCGRTLAWFELIPLVSFAALRGRCRRCGAPIPRRDLLIEALGGAAGLACGIAFLPDIGTALAALCFLLLLLAAATVDAETGYLPDALTLPAVWLGLVTAAVGVGGTSASGAVLGAATGYAALRLIADGYAALRGREGLGRGDAKLLAAGGAWLGPLALPLVLLLAALAGLAAVTLRAGAVRADTELRFGPYLAGGIAGVALLAGALPGRVVPAWPLP